MITATTALLLSGGAVIGFLLAVLGAGGSILLLPLLVSGADLSTKTAVPLSLLVVTLLALGNLGPYLRRRQVAINPALLLGLPALVGSWIGGSLVKAGLIPEPVLLGIFAAAALVASWLMLRPRALAQPCGGVGRSAGSPAALAGQGVLAGLPMQLGQRHEPGADQPQLPGGFCRPGPLASSPPTADLAVDRRWRHSRVHRPATGASPAGTAAAPGVLSPADRFGPAHRL